MIVRGGRDKRRDVQDDVAIPDARPHFVVVVEISPDNGESFRIEIGREQFSVLLGIAGKDHDVLLIGVFEHLF